ncbi:ferredoxin-thioredoxin reductase catalytic domain-containing protein [Methanoregula sp.]|uniref:ferredoxin-thioredoxin reductase catalytic domain-containing protein n=1 Tax=Methanoregula sp. TaxID=2052170 RepID=UPI0026196D42|nr:ferredoxin-thioredoxin reductase catalytic domain-containing protein [Methanoregula sp.]MDD5142115.1 ferredoxin-thioredoxin reductase catalytic domain-containing protein [Methanoregula sp.]
MTFTGISEQEVDRAYDSLKNDALDGGYRLNPDAEFVKNLIRGLLKNEQRYGYRACPCRLASGKMEVDLDIVCPCDYRDSDIEEYGACYCALYVSEAITDGTRKVAPVPERRPPRSQRGTMKERAVQTVAVGGGTTFGSLPFPVWRCKVCGYLCARDQPPGICPVCKAKKDRFERFL